MWSPVEQRVIGSCDEYYGGGAHNCDTNTSWDFTASRWLTSENECPIQSVALQGAMTAEEANFCVWDKSCQEIEETWGVCTNEDDGNHAFIMENCPFTCAQARGEVPADPIPPPS